MIVLRCPAAFSELSASLEQEGPIAGALATFAWPGAVLWQPAALMTVFTSRAPPWAPTPP